MLRYIITLMLVVCVLPTTYAVNCSNAKLSPYPTTPAANYEHDKFGTWPRDIYVEYNAFVSSFDSDDDDDWDGYEDRSANPEWVAYEIKRYKKKADGTYKKPQGATKRPQKWYKAPEINYLFNNPALTSDRLDDSYRGVGDFYNRGHLARKLHADRINWQAGCNTHHLTNAVPQVAGFNQGIWLDMENITGAYANKYGRVWIITGPIFYYNAPIYVIGDQGEVPVDIPHALFKIVIKQQNSTAIPDVLAFIYPQWDVQYYKTGSCRGDKSYDHAHFLVSVDQIERVTGLSFFENLNISEDDKRTLKTTVADSLWPVEKKYFGDSCQ